MAKQTAPCPGCKEAVGWWEKRVTSWAQYYMANGKVSHASDNLDSNGRGGRRKFCYNCNRDITKLIQD